MTRPPPLTATAASSGQPDPAPLEPIGDEARFQRLFEAAYDDVLRFVERRVHSADGPWRAGR